MRRAARSYSLGELVRLLGGELNGDPAQEVTQVAPLEAAGPEHISFLGSEAYRKALAQTKAGAVIVQSSVAVTGRSSIRTANPYAYFVRVAALLNPEPGSVPGIHPMACVHPEADVAQSAQLSPFVTVEIGARIGERVRLGPGCHVGAYARIGDEAWLHGNVSVYARCEIGARTVINAGAVIGADGFGGVMEQGRWLKMPHIGRVLIGDDVDIGANTTIDRGAMADTVIENGAKLDNQIQVGHNVHIGANTSVAGCVGIAGSTRIGANCVIGGAAMITGHLRLADNVIISTGTVVMASIDRPGRYTGIYPASEHRAWLKSAVNVRRLGGNAEAARKGSASRSSESEENDNDGNRRDP